MSSLYVHEILTHYLSKKHNCPSKCDNTVFNFVFQVVDSGQKSCLYISTGTQWPYRYHPIDTTSEENIAAFTCENNGLKLAEISNPAEHQALLELASTYFQKSLALYL